MAQHCWVVTQDSPSFTGIRNLRLSGLFTSVNACMPGQGSELPGLISIWCYTTWHPGTAVPSSGGSHLFAGWDFFASLSAHPGIRIAWLSLACLFLWLWGSYIPFTHCTNWFGLGFLPLSRVSAAGTGCSSGSAQFEWSQCLDMLFSSFPWGHCPVTSSIWEALARGQHIA